jgi:hypothetical protein
MNGCASYIKDGQITIVWVNTAPIQAEAVVTNMKQVITQWQ